MTEGNKINRAGVNARLWKNEECSLNRRSPAGVSSHMKKWFAKWSVATAGSLAALTLVSCVYDPYESGFGYRTGTYGGGYRRIDTSVFISTGNSRWGYDPYRSCYYDYQRRCYYDPFLYGYYPVNYCPPRLPGSPHPYGWRPGLGVCPPPQNIRTVYLPNHQNRVNLYQAGTSGWNPGYRSRYDVDPPLGFSRSGSGQSIQQNPFSSGFSPNRPAEGRGFNGLRQNQQPDRQQGRPAPSGFRNRLFEGQSPEQPGFEESGRPLTRYQTPIAHQDLGSDPAVQQEAAAPRQQAFSTPRPETFRPAAEASSPRQAASQRGNRDLEGGHERH